MEDVAGIDHFLQTCRRDERFESVTDHQRGAGIGRIDGQQQVAALPSFELAANTTAIEYPKCVGGERLSGFEAGRHDGEAELRKAFGKSRDKTLEPAGVPCSEEPGEVGPAGIEPRHDPKKLFDSLDRESAPLAFRLGFGGRGVAERTDHRALKN